MEHGMNNSTQKADSIISSIFSDIGSSLKEANKTVSIWNKVLLSIKSSKIDGSQLADHSKILDLKNHQESCLLLQKKKHILQLLLVNLPQMR